jgi:hypothetical protein
MDWSPAKIKIVTDMQIYVVSLTRTRKASSRYKHKGSEETTIMPSVMQHRVIYYQIVQRHTSTDMRTPNQIRHMGNKFSVSVFMEINILSIVTL